MAAKWEKQGGYGRNFLKQYVQNDGNFLGGNAGETEGVFGQKKPGERWGNRSPGGI